jgi:hypothetical protein
LPPPSSTQQRRTSSFQLAASSVARLLQTWARSIWLEACKIWCNEYPRTKRSKHQASEQLVARMFAQHPACWAVSRLNGCVPEEKIECWFYGGGGGGDGGTLRWMFIVLVIVSTRVLRGQFLSSKSIILWWSPSCLIDDVIIIRSISDVHSSFLL